MEVSLSKLFSSSVQRSSLWWAVCVSATVHANHPVLPGQFVCPALRECNCSHADSLESQADSLNGGAAAGQETQRIKAMNLSESERRGVLQQLCNKVHT